MVTHFHFEYLPCLHKTELSDGAHKGPKLRDGIKCVNCYLFYLFRIASTKKCYLMLIVLYSFESVVFFFNLSLTMNAIAHFRDVSCVDLAMLLLFTFFSTSRTFHISIYNFFLLFRLYYFQHRWDLCNLKRFVVNEI